MAVGAKKIEARADQAIREAKGDWDKARELLREEARSDGEFQAALVEKILTVEVRRAATRLGATTKVCPFCREQIVADAAKCNNCGEWLGEPVSTAIPRRPARSISSAVTIRHFTLLTGWVLIVLIMILIISLNT